ncbi:right-handed parallel beta-helix repeat-containing protein [bacterium]|nr:right-handed parallel beta-helix repeat-containing protein [candidate division CSSED10-310 bacterium]
MKRLSLFHVTVLMTFWIPGTITLAQAPDFQAVIDSPGTPYDHGPRIDTAMVSVFDAFTNRDYAFLYGGRGKSGAQDIFMDYHGDVWGFRIYSAFKNPQILWERRQTDPFLLMDLETPGTLQDEEYPPLPRFGHSGVLCLTLDDSILHNDDQPTKKETDINFIVFGGKRQAVRNAQNRVIDGNAVITNELYIFAEYRINTGDGKDIRYHWYRVEPTLLNETWPSPRMYAQIVPLFNEQDPIENRNRFLLFGGIDDSGTICADAYVGTLTRTLTPTAPEGNEWAFDIGLDVQFEAVTLDAGECEAIRVYGAAAVYDRYFFQSSALNDPIPRVIFLGGMKGPENNPASSKVICIEPGDATDWTDPMVYELTQADMGTTMNRAFFSAVLNDRNNRIEVTGGESEGQTRNSIGYLDLTDMESGWIWMTGSTSGCFPDVSHHSGCYSHSATVYCVENGAGSPERKLYVDKTAQLPMEWNVGKNEQYGLTNPEAVTNTRRLRSGDTIRILQENDDPGCVNDCYRCSINVPVWCKDVTIEGVVLNGIKPILYQLYSPENTWDPLWYLEGSDENRFAREMMEVVYSHGPITLKNLTICHFDEDPVGPYALMPEVIPSDRLADYSDYTNPPVPNREWDLALHHVDDPGIFMHAESRVENCDLTLNGVGIAMICVSSALDPASVTHCTFTRNFMGLVALEKDHLIAGNTFTDNYLAGIAIDKGSNTNIRDNLFKGNGWLSDNPENIYGLEDYSAAILSDFAMTARVPLIQNPFIYNNTFVSNHRVLTIKDDAYRGQYMNRPVFFNNIVYDPEGTQSPLFIDDSQNRSDVICRNTCFFTGDGIDILETRDPASPGFILSDTLQADPLLDEPDWTLSATSPCIDRGLYLLEVGITSLLNYPDFRFLDIGYHYPLYTGAIPEAPENPALSLSVPMITFQWDPVSWVSGYLVLVEAESGVITTAYVTTESFAFNPGIRDNLWFGVMSHQNQQIYSDCVWLEWIGE